MIIKLGVLFFYGFWFDHFTVDLVIFGFDEGKTRRNGPIRGKRIILCVNMPSMIDRCD